MKLYFFLLSILRYKMYLNPSVRDWLLQLWKHSNSLEEIARQRYPMIQEEQICSGVRIIPIQQGLSGVKQLLRCLQEMKHSDSGYDQSDDGLIRKKPSSQKIKQNYGLLMTMSCDSKQQVLSESEYSNIYLRCRNNREPFCHFWTSVIQGLSLREL